MTSRRAFANLITLNMATLMATYAQYLVEQDAAYHHFSPHRRKAAARKLLRGVVAACETGTTAPLRQFFNQPNNGHARWGTESPHPNPEAEVAALAQTLDPLLHEEEVSHFVRRLLTEIRTGLPKNKRRSQVLPPPAVERGVNGQIEPASPPTTLSSIARLEQIQLTMDSRLVDLPVYAFQVDISAIVIEVEKILRRHVTLPGVIITENDVAVGVISRRKFYEKLGQLYGIAVYLRRPIHLMLKDFQLNLLCLAATTPIPEALRLALSRPPMFVYEPIVVELEPKTYRLLDVYTLLMAQSRLFANLQNELQQTNAELEARVEQRTIELVQANTDLTAEITKRRETEEALITTRDEALAASRFKSELLAKVSHELRTPMGAILGFTEMLQVGVYGPVSSQQAEVAAKIIDSTNYLTSLVNQLLDQSRFEAHQLSLDVSRLSPSVIVEDTVAKLGLLAEQKGLTLVMDIAADVPVELSGDPVRVQQILVNLVSNAIKFTESGQVAIRIFCPTEAHWAMQVADTGPGIPFDAQERIFEPFGQVDGSITRKHGGTGLGLAIVKQLTQLMAGQIGLESRPGQGSAFTVTLPLEHIQEPA